MPNLLGTAPNQVPTNADLGKLAFMDVVDTVTNNPYVDTAISDTKPSLLLDFANSKTLDPRITYTRASTATYFDPNGVMQTAAAGVPRFDHDPVTGESKGFLIEEQRTNLLTYSEQFDNGVWGKQNITTVSDTIVAPNGTLTGDKLVESTLLSNKQIYSTVGTTAQAYTWSVYVKYAGRQYFSLGFSASAYRYAWFDLLTGTTSGASNCTSSIAAVGNGWYRCSITATAAAENTYAQVFLGTSASGYAPAYTGDGYSGIFIWGAQLEAGSFATSYIPTTSAQVTRSADAASMTGANFSSWYRADEGTVYCEFSIPFTRISGTGSVLQIDDGTLNNRLFLANDYFSSASKIGSAVIVNGVIQENSYPVSSGQVANTVYKEAFSLAVNNFAHTINGSVPLTDTAGSIPAVNQLNIGKRLSDLFLNGTIKKLAYYPKRLSDAEIQEMTL